MKQKILSFFLCLTLLAWIPVTAHAAGDRVYDITCYFYYQTVDGTGYELVETWHRVSEGSGQIKVNNPGKGFHEANSEGQESYDPERNWFTGVYKYWNDRNTCMLNYVLEGDIPEGVSAPAPVGFLYEAPISLVSMPEVAGYTFSGWDLSAGTPMGAKGLTATGSYTKTPESSPEPSPEPTPEPTPAPTSEKHRLLIRYVAADSAYQSEMPAPYGCDLAAGEEYLVFSPGVAGFTANRASVSGTMPDHDLTMFVAYTRLAGPEPTPEPMPEPTSVPTTESTTEPTPAPEPTEAPADEVTRTEELAEEEVPLAALFGAAWGLLNLLCAIGSVGLGLFALLKKDEEGKRKSRWFNLLPAIGAVAAFMLTEDMRLPMRLTDKWTLLMVGILAVSALLAYFTTKKKKTEETEA